MKRTGRRDGTCHRRLKEGTEPARQFEGPIAQARLAWGDHGHGARERVTHVPERRVRPWDLCQRFQAVPPTSGAATTGVGVYASGRVWMTPKVMAAGADTRRGYRWLGDKGIVLRFLITAAGFSRQ